MSTTPAAYDIPKYVKGYVFRNDRRYWDASKSWYVDQAGYGPANAAPVTVGAPAWSTHGANLREGQLFDRSCQLACTPAIPWEGTMLLIAKMSMAANATIYPVLCGAAATVTSNGNVALVRATGSDFRVKAATAGSALSNQVMGMANNAIFAIAFSWNQALRKIFATLDGVTVAASSAAAASNHGNAIAPGYCSTVGVGGQAMRIGDNANGTTTADGSNFWYGFELHCWKDDVLNNSGSLAKLATLIADRKAYYAWT